MPVAVEEPTVMVMVEDPDPGAAMLAGENDAVAPAGSPEAARATAEEKPPETDVVIVAEPEEPCAMDVELGEAEIAKLGVEAGVTVKVTVAVCVLLPPVPVMVTV